VEQLVAAMPPDDIYPQGVVAPIKPKLHGRSFFPGGSGSSIGASHPIPPGRVMLVGQDFGTLAYWSEVGTDGESSQGTWSGLQRMLSRAEVVPEACFFTNVLLGVRESGPIDGPSPGLAFPEYVKACTSYLVEQVRIVRPSVVVALGSIPIVLLARKLDLAASLSPPGPNESHNAGWRDIDEVGIQFLPKVALPGVGSFAFATSVHPDRHWLNWRHRSWSSHNASGAAAHDLIWTRVREAAR
jgi:uracil-DNA glycosylase